MRANLRSCLEEFHDRDNFVNPVLMMYPEGRSPSWNVMHHCGFLHGCGRRTTDRASCAESRYATGQMLNQRLATALYSIKLGTTRTSSSSCSCGGRSGPVGLDLRSTACRHPRAPVRSFAKIHSISLCFGVSALPQLVRPVSLSVNNAATVLFLKKSYQLNFGLFKC